jgi:hypothetical protein
VTERGLATTSAIWAAPFASGSSTRRQAAAGVAGVADGRTAGLATAALADGAAVGLALAGVTGDRSGVRLGVDVVAADEQAATASDVANAAIIRIGRDRGAVRGNMAVGRQTAGSRDGKPAIR